MSELDYMKNLVMAHRMDRRQFIGRATALGMSAAAATALYSKTSKAAMPATGGHMVIGLVGGSSADSLDPATHESQVPYTFAEGWGDTLVMVSREDASPAPRLATSWEASADVKSWTFTIRTGVQFHNGKEMTVDDVIATLHRHSDENSQSGALGIMQGIESIDKVDNTRFTINLTTPNADLPFLMSDYHLIIQPNGGMDGPAAGIGTGAYIIEENDAGVRSSATKNPNYWGDVGYVDSFEILTINDDTARMAAMQSGEVHAVNRVDPKTADLLNRVPGIEVRHIGGRGHYVMIMHADTAPFDNVDVRMALKLAIDRDAMVNSILAGYGTKGNDFPINAAYDLFPADIEQRVYDPERARFHMQKSGHEGPIILRTSDAAFPGAVDASVLYQQHAQACGIDLQVQQEPDDGYWSNVWNVQPFCCSYWGGRPTQDQMYSVAYQSNADWNDTKWRRENFDAMLIEARGELDRTKRAQIYHDMAVFLRDDGGLILPMFNDWVDCISDDVVGYEDDPSSELMNARIMLECGLAS